MSNELFSEDPLITVVIATYNRSGLVMEAIGSVLAQTYTKWELIVADDGSGDDTVERVRSMSDPRIRVLALPHSGNVATVRNAGARAGSGAWIAFLDSDDMWMPQKLETQLILLAGTSRRWTYGGYVLIDQAGNAVSPKAGRYMPFSGWIIKDLLTTEASVNMGTLLVERILFEEVGGFDTEPLINYREDYDLALRLAMRAETVASTEILMRVREHQGREGNAIDIGNARTACVYLHFIKTCSGKTKSGEGLIRLARRRLAYHLAEAAMRNMGKGSYLPAFRQFVLALRNGDKWTHLLAAFRRGISARRANNH